MAIDPTALADSLVVRLRVPPRAAYSALAAFRLLPLLGRDWTVLGRATRARGVAARGVIGRARAFGSGLVRLLVAALRRGTRLATALDSRGLRSETPRTFARPVRWTWSDSVALALGALAVVAVVAIRLGSR